MQVLKSGINKKKFTFLCTNDVQPSRCLEEFDFRRCFTSLLWKLNRKTSCVLLGHSEVQAMYFVNVFGFNLQLYKELAI